MLVEDWDVTYQHRTVTQSAPRMYTYVALEINTSGAIVAKECATKTIRICVAHSIGKGEAN